VLCLLEKKENGKRSQACGMKLVVYYCRCCKIFNLIILVTGKIYCKKRKNMESNENNDTNTFFLIFALMLTILFFEIIDVYGLV